MDDPKDVIAKKIENKKYKYWGMACKVGGKSKVNEPGELVSTKSTLRFISKEVDKRRFADSISTLHLI